MYRNSKLSTALVVFISLCGSALCQDWTVGRATFYGNEPWLWSIHYGSCGYGYLCPEEGTGWDVAALADVHPEYSASCGRCYEVQCNPTYFTDGYGQTLDRVGVCRDASSSVVVTVTDTCPCIYATNAYSNKRWCCGDMNHFDLSVWAFEKLAEHRWGVIGLKYRQVPCDFQPSNPAPVPPEGPFWGEEPEAYGQTCPKHQFPIRGASAATSEASIFATESSAQDEAASVVNAAPQEAKTTTLYGENGEGTFALSNWNAEVWEIPGAGVNGGHGVCGKVYPGGAISLQGAPGSFDGHMMVEFWTKTDEGVANAAINIQGSSRGCHPLMFQKLQPVEHQDGYSRYSVALSQFVDGNHDPVDIANPSTLVECNGMSISDIERVSFHNYEGYQQFFCVDEVALTSGAGN
eukprot:TRINITY_DN392_c0_g1_i1.p2 TRINITY_DN392_c0_g1~~TRINITY_DN392_c0_g1_i1.p2  ORF type:complete len:406 (-),score=57.98 TRINITY_DN392_c0_g1_i1:1727-2944(-)